MDLDIEKIIQSDGAAHIFVAGALHTKRNHIGFAYVIQGNNNKDIEYHERQSVDKTFAGGQFVATLKALNKALETIQPSIEVLVYTDQEELANLLNMSQKTRDSLIDGEPVGALEKAIATVNEYITKRSTIKGVVVNEDSPKEYLTFNNRTYDIAERAIYDSRAQKGLKKQLTSPPPPNHDSSDAMNVIDGELSDTNEIPDPDDPMGLRLPPRKPTGPS